MPPTDSIGSTAIAITTIPTPPSHCNRARQIKIPGDAISIFTNTVDPVVVMPETDSKIESVMLSSSSLNINGNAPKTLMMTQAPLVSRNACRSPSSSVSRRFVANHADTPKNPVSNADMANTCQSDEPV